MPSNAMDVDQGQLHRPCFGCGSTEHLWKDCPWHWNSAWSSTWTSTSAENVYVDESGHRWVRSDPMVGSIQEQQQQTQVDESKPIPPQPLSGIRVLRGSSPLRSSSAPVVAQTLSVIQTKVQSNENEMKYDNDEKIYEKLLDEFYTMKKTYEEFSKMVYDMKEKQSQDHLTTGIQVSCLRDEIKNDLKGLREDLWYQCDHMKFVNLIDSKFKHFESKFEKYLYEPNANNENESTDMDSENEKNSFSNDSEEESTNSEIEHKSKEEENKFYFNIHNDSEFI